MFETLESRVLLSADVLPIDPSPGEQNLLNIIDSLPLNNIQNALDHFPIPYVVIAQQDGNAPVIENNRAGAPTRIDVDNSLATGKGGKDLQVEVNTQLFDANGQFSPHLDLTINRLGTSNFVQDFSIIIAFPFDAFTNELLPGESNLFFGFQTTAADGSDGGIAPVSEKISFTPGTLGGTEHLFNLDISTVGDTNPLRFFAGHFDGDVNTGVLNFDGLSAWVQEVPDNIKIGLDVAENALFTPNMFTSLGLTWDATSASKVEFSYVENESAPGGTSDYTTTLTVDRMPTHEALSLSMNEATQSLTLSHRASAEIGEMVFQKTREDGLIITAKATDIPTEVDLTVDLDPSVTLNVNNNTLDLALEIQRQGGIPGTSGFFGYDLGYARVAVTDAPDLTATWDNALTQFSVQATNPGEEIGAIEFVIGDDTNLELPPAPSFGDQWNPANPNAVLDYHLFSLIDDGTHGTAVGRLVHVQSATLDLNADATETFNLVTTQAAPLLAYVRTTPSSQILPKDAEITIEIQDVPAGTLDFNFDGPGKFSYTTLPPAGIDSIRVFGHIDTLNFDVDAGDLPAAFSYDFDPDSYLTVVAEDGFGGSDPIGHLAVRLWDETGPGLPGSSALFGEALRDARMRVDDLPSFHATWSDDAAGTVIDFDTDGLGVFVGGAQIDVSTVVGLSPLSAATVTSSHYGRLIDKQNEKRLAAGAFGIDNFRYESNDAARTFDLHYDANADHALDLSIESVFGKFFPTFDIDVDFGIDDVPNLFDLLLDLDPSLDYTASDVIDEIILTGILDNTNDNTDNGTLVDFLFQGLPDEVHFDLDPAGSASLNMSDAIDLVSLSLSSEDNVAKIIGTNDYRLIQVELTDISSTWTADWAGDDFIVEANAPMGEVSALISTSANTGDNAGKIAPFQNAANFTVSRSTFQQEIDDRYWPDDVSQPGANNDALDDLYGDGEQLDVGEDHVVIRQDGGKIDFASLQFTGFQTVSIQPSVNDGRYEFRAPSPGTHPLFFGLEDDDQYTTIQVENIPDSVVVALDFGGGSINFDAADSMGQIDFYQGPLAANDGSSVTRVIMNDTPSFVHINWNFGFPDGSASFDASNPFQLLFLSQTGGDSRIVAGLQMEDLTLDYGLDILPLDLDVDWPFPLPVPTSVDLNLLTWHADLTAGTGGVDGFFALYDFLASPGSLTPSGTAAEGGEFVPELTLMLKNFEQFHFDASLQVEVFPLIGTPEIEINTNVSVGSLVFDVWTTSDIDETIGIDGIFEIGYRNPADYKDGTPIHIWPFEGLYLETVESAVINFIGLHNFSDHPGSLFSLVAAESPSAMSGRAVTEGDLAPIVSEAVARWSAAGVDTSALNGVEIRIADLDGLALAQVEGNILSIDVDAAGYGWFIDPTPSDDGEFASDWTAIAGESPAGSMDLLTAITHEFGHILGYDHNVAQSGEVMDPVLDAGERNLGGLTAESDGLTAAAILLFDPQDGTLTVWTPRWSPTEDGADEQQDYQVFDEYSGHFVAAAA